MGKQHEFLTPKAIANRIKAAGLQKLRWYCPMCRKQCRDENGFQCHCMSEGHLRLMELFGQNPDAFVEEFSEMFENDFLEHMKRSRCSSTWVAANVVYNEFIAFRHHVHMKATKWATLTEFVKYLGKSGKCKVDETPKGWFVAYVNREPEQLLKESLKNKRQRAESAYEQRHEREIMEQAERAAKYIKSEASHHVPATQIPQSKDGVSKIAFSLIGSSGKSTRKRYGATSYGNQTARPSVVTRQQTEERENKDTEEKLNEDTQLKGIGPKDGMNEYRNTGHGVLEQLFKEQEQSKEKLNRKDNWICEGLVVKVISKALADKGYYKQKGVVRKVTQKYTGEIKMLDTGAVLQVHQDELETVIPQIGGLVRVVNGAYRGSTAKLISVNSASFSAEVKLQRGIYDGRFLPAIDYEDICKFVAVQ